MKCLQTRKLQFQFFCVVTKLKANTYSYENMRPRGDAPIASSVTIPRQRRFLTDNRKRRANCSRDGKDARRRHTRENKACFSRLTIVNRDVGVVFYYKKIAPRTVDPKEETL